MKHNNDNNDNNNINNNNSNKNNKTWRQFINMMKFYFFERDVGERNSSEVGVDASCYYYYNYYY